MLKKDKKNYNTLIRVYGHTTLFESILPNFGGGVLGNLGSPEKLIALWVVADISLVYQIERVRKS